MGRTAPSTELLRRALRSLRRSGFWWALGIAAFGAVNAAFWPSLEGSEALQAFNDMEAMLEAFGAQGIATPAGYLDGQVYALMLPMLLSGMAIAQVSAITSGDEDAGRLEVLHALPVSRRAIWLASWGSSLVVLTIVAAISALTMLTLLPFVSLEEVGPLSILAATFGCTVLAAFHGAIAYMAGGLGARRGLSVGLAVVTVIVGYVLNFLMPLADALAWARWLSPWHWAIGEQPVSDGPRIGRLLVLAAVISACVWLGTVRIERRDIRSA